MGILGYSNEDIDVFRFNGVVDTNPSAVGYDTNIFKTVIACTQGIHSHRIYFKDQNWGGAARSSFRYQVVTQHGTDSNLQSVGGAWMEFKNIADGRNLFRIFKPTTGNLSLSYPYYWDGAAWVQVGAGFSIPTTPTVQTVEIIISDTVGTFRWWVNGALMGERTGDTKLTASTEIDAVDHHGIMSSQFGYTTRWGGHFLCTADYAPFGLQPANPAIDGAGAVATQDSGAYTDVNELTNNRASGITLDTDGDGFSGTVANLAGTAATAPIMAVRVACDVRCGAAGPQSVRLFVRVSGTNYYSSSIPVVGIGFATVAWLWELNPATSAPWTVAEFNAIEIGCEADT